MAPLSLADCAHATTYRGDTQAARYVMQWYANRKRWADETLRARWDGASALLGWWYTLGEPVLG